MMTKFCYATSHAVKYGLQEICFDSRLVFFSEENQQRNPQRNESCSPFPFEIHLIAYLAIPCSEKGTMTYIKKKGNQQATKTPVEERRERGYC